MAKEETDPEKLNFIMEVTEEIGEEVKNLDPGIRGLVVWLNMQGFETCDSGDGVSKFTDRPPEPFYELDYPHIFIQTAREDLQSTTDRLWASLALGGLVLRAPKDAQVGQRIPGISGRYEPYSDVCFVELANVTTAMVPDAYKTEQELEDAIETVYQLNTNSKNKLFN